MRLSFSSFNSKAKILLSILASGLLAFATLSVSASPAASAEDPSYPVGVPAPLCEGETAFEPTENDGFAVTDLTQIFGARTGAFSDGHIVPLYDAYGGSILIDSDGEVTGDAAYPPLCGTRYVPELEMAASEWMFCTDRDSQSCGDTDAGGNLVDKEGQIIERMTGLTGNARLSEDQERIISYLVQHGHTYEGIGDQAWEGVAEARSDMGTYERVALQTLVWCVSDPADSDTAFAKTCEANMDEAEQARILSLAPAKQVLLLEFDSSGSTI